MSNEIDVETLSGQPRKVMSDGESLENHSLKDQMEAAKFLRGSRVFDEPDTGLGIKLVKMTAPGGE
jgi:hypothetical protein